MILQSNLSIYPREMKTHVHTKNLYTDVYSSTIDQCPQMEKLQIINKQINIYLITR